MSITEAQQIAKEGGPAFPQPCTESGFAANGPYGVAGGGMSIRDWFAGMALGAHVEASVLLVKESGGECNPSGDQIAAGCYKLADAMIAERNKL